MNILLATATGLMLAASLGGGADHQLVNRRVELMGTVLWMELEVQDRTVGLNASEEALKTMEAAERRLSTWTTETELARFLTSQVGERVTLTPLLAKELSEAARLCEITGGAFDPSIGALTRAWNLRTGALRPNESALKDAMSSCGPALWQINGLEAVRETEGLVIDEGGFGKGAALDQATAKLRECGVRSGSLNFGGQLAFVGDEQRSVPVAHPRSRDEVAIELIVSGGSVATSANAERAGHLLDPRTGLPAEDFGSVTVWAKTALEADALSTAFFVLGPREGYALATQLEGVEAAFIQSNKTEMNVYVTPGLSNRTRSLNEGAVFRTLSTTAGKRLLLTNSEN